MTVETDTHRIIPLSAITALSEAEQDEASFRARDRGWAAVYGAFVDREENEALTYAELGERIGRTKSQVHRWLSSPFNMSIGSLGLLAEGLNSDLEIALFPRCEQDSRLNYCHPIEDAGATKISQRPNVSTISVPVKMTVVRRLDAHGLEV